MAALPNTDTLDIPSGGLPATYIINLTTAPDVDTTNLDVPSRGLPTEYMRAANTSSGGGIGHCFSDEGIIF